MQPEPERGGDGSRSRRSWRRRQSLTMVAAFVIGAAIAGGALAATHRSLWPQRSEPATTNVASSTTAPPTTTRPTTTTQPEVASLRSLSVASCSTLYGASPPPVYWTPSALVAELPPSIATRLSFYSGGGNTLLAPTGWQCNALVAGDGGQSLAAFPPGSPDPSVSGRVASAGVLLDVDYTGHGPGNDVVCAYFPGSPAVAVARSIGSTCALPTGTHVQRLTPDIVAFTQGTSSGVVIYPQVNDPQTSVTVAKLSCNAGALCPYIVSDVLARYAPNYTPGT